ncbi:MAG: type I restriction enzyme HsdR N-terminal domain-containing protein [Flavobacteriales bacterium]
MQQLNLPDHGVKTRHAPGGDHVFDPFRRRWVALTPEEWVRQHFLNYLVQDLGCPASLISVEHTIALNRLAKRVDLVVHDHGAKPLLLVECKAPHVPLDQRVLEQVARYNIVFRVPYLFVTNGLMHYACRVDHAAGTVDFLGNIPSYAEMQGG